MGNETVSNELRPIFEAIDQWDEKKLRDAFSKQQSLRYFFAVWVYDYHMSSRDKTSAESYLTRLTHLTGLFPLTDLSLGRDIVLLAAAGLQEIGCAAPGGPLLRILTSRHATSQQRSTALRRLTNNLRRRL